MADDQVWCTATGTVDGLPTTLELTDAGLSVRTGTETPHTLPLHQVTGVDAQVGLLTGYVVVSLGEQDLTVARVPKHDARAFVEALRAQLRHRPPAPEPAHEQPDDSSPLAELERLGRLHASGVLTDEEFETAKQTLLGRL